MSKIYVFHWDKILVEEVRKENKITLKEEFFLVHFKWMLMDIKSLRLSLPLDTFKNN